MFKKPFVLGNSHLVSGSDRKKLRRDVQLKLQCSDEQLDALLPPKAWELVIYKLHDYKLYMLKKEAKAAGAGCPILLESKNEVWPTCFGLWSAPQALLISITLKHPAVSQFVIGGADLMLPGVAMPDGGFPKFRDWALCSISVPGNPAPFAVGRLLLSSEKATERVQAGKGGKLVEILHSFGDKLWELGAAAGVGLPNEGYRANVVLPLGWNAEDQAQYEEETGEGEEGGDPALASLSLESPVVGDGPEASEPQAGVQAPASSAGGAEGTQEDAMGCGDEGASAIPTASPGAQDDLLQTCLLQALHTRVKDADLPLAGSAMWTHMLQCRPPGQHLDLKASSFKKLSNFLKAQKEAGLLATKVEKHSNETLVQRVFRECPLYRAFRPYSTTLEVGSATSDSAASASAPAIAVHTTSTEASMTIEERFRVGRELEPVFSGAGLDPEALYLPSDVEACVAEYITRAGLTVAASSNRVVLNAELSAALFKGLMKKGEGYPTELERKDVVKAMMKRMHPVNLVRRGVVEVAKKGALPPVQISVRSFGKKKVTSVIGLETFLLDPALLSKDFAKRFACASGTEKLAGARSNQLEVKIQGDIPDKVAECLTSSWGIPAGCVTTKR